MVDLKPTNMKLVGRTARIVTQATGCTTEQAQEALRLTNNDVKLAILYGYGHASQTRQIGLAKRGRLPPQGNRVAP
jgi:N-acetylmuramic acid 6-phosphate (MurNAc-6-P) etherase